MLLKRISKISQIFGLMGMILGMGAFAYTNAAMVGSSAAAFDDDDKRKGRGKGGDQRGDRGKGGDRSDRGRSSQQDSDRESRRQQKESDQNSRRQQRSSDNESRRQQQRSDENSRRQQRNSDGESRRQQEWSNQNARRKQWESDRESHRQQAQSNRNARQQQENGGREARRQQARSDENSRRQQQWSDWNSRRQQQISNQRPVNYRGRDNNRGRDDRRRGDDRRVVYASPGAYWGHIFSGSPVYRVDNRRFAREQRRVLKDQRKAQRQYQRNQQSYARNQYGGYSAPVYRYDGNNYYPNQSAYSSGSSWKDQILPMLIANIFGGDGGFDKGGGFPVQRYYSASSNVRSYDYRQPAYSPVHSYEPSYDNYGYNETYDYNEQGLDSGSLLNSLPIAEIIEQYTGENEFVSSLIGSFLTQGYDQGRLAGQSARQNGYTEDQYNDPYTYENGACDPYSVSLGENRRYLSEGYEQGYRDALAGNENYDQGNIGDSDLVSVLLNSVLSGV